jgi:hypothetical protein
VNEFEFEFVLADGRHLIVTGRIEEPDESASVIDAEGFGAALLGALGLNRPTRQVPKPKRAKRRQPVDDEDADAWLVRTSRESLSQMEKK